MWYAVCGVRKPYIYGSGCGRLDQAPVDVTQKLGDVEGVEAPTTVLQRSNDDQHTGAM